MTKQYLTGTHKNRYPSGVYNLTCGECGAPMEFDFVNESNLDDNGAVLKCTGSEHHTGWVDVPISRANFLFRYIRGQFQNRDGTLRNRILTALRLCTCTNTYHGHREGIHAFLDKGGNCPVCDKWTNPNNPYYDSCG